MNNRSRIIAVALALVLVPAVAGARWIELEDSIDRVTRVDLLHESASGAAISVDLPGFEIIEQDVDGTRYQEIQVPELATTSEVGRPQIPYILVKVALPDASGVHIRSIDVGYERIPGSYRVIPVPEPTTDVSAKVRYGSNPGVYQMDVWYPAKSAELDSPAILRDARFVNLRIYPIRYNPALKALEAARTVEVELDFSGVGENPKTSRTFRMTPSLRTRYEKAFINFDSWAGRIQEVQSRELTTKYLIITKDGFEPLLADFAAWQTSRGLKAEIVPMSTVGSSSADVRTFITDYYNTLGIEYVLLAGDIADIPIGSRGGYPSDYYYSCIDGSDDYADVGVGRFSAATAEEMTHQVNKTLTYEQNAPSGAWVSNVILCAHEENAPGKYQGCKEDIRTFNYGLESPNFITAYAYEGDDADDVNNALNAGVGVVNYRGHGSETAWSWRGGYDVGDIAGHTATDKIPVVFNICCLNGAVDRSGDCLAESFMKADTGSVGNLSASRSSWTAENHVFDRDLFYNLFDDGITIASHTVDDAKAAIIDYSSGGVDNANMYLWFGDPALDIWTQLPGTLNVVVPTVIPIIQDELKIRLESNGQPLPNAMIVLIKDPEILVSDYTDISGTAIIPIAAATPGMMDVKVTAHNVLPQAFQAEIGDAGCGNLHIDKSFYAKDDEVFVKLWDADLDLDGGAIDTAEVFMATDGEPAGETLVLTETDLNTGAFVGSIIFSDTESGPGYLLIVGADTVVATYDDADCEGAPQTSSDYGSVDAHAPVISGVEVTDYDDNDFTVEFMTDEPATTVIEYGETPALGEVKSDAALTTGHDITVTGLDEQTLYYFLVRSEDMYGNESVDDNGGDLYTIETEKDYFCRIQALAADDGRIAEIIPEMRSFRDNILGSTPAGRQITDDYYRFGREVGDLFEAHPELRTEALRFALILVRTRQLNLDDSFSAVLDRMLSEHNEEIRVFLDRISELTTSSDLKGRLDTIRLDRGVKGILDVQKVDRIKKVKKMRLERAR